MNTTIKNNTLIQQLPNEEGFFGNYGGQFIPDVLKAEFKKIETAYLALKNDPMFSRS